MSKAQFHTRQPVFSGESAFFDSPVALSTPRPGDNPSKLQMLIASHEAAEAALLAAIRANDVGLEDSAWRRARAAHDAASVAEDAAALAVFSYRCASFEEAQTKAQYLLACPIFRDGFTDRQTRALLESQASLPTGVSAASKLTDAPLSNTPNSPDDEALRDLIDRHRAAVGAIDSLFGLYEATPTRDLLRKIEALPITKALEAQEAAAITALCAFPCRTMEQVRSKTAYFYDEYGVLPVEGDYDTFLLSLLGRPHLVDDDDDNGEAELIPDLETMVADAELPSLAVLDAIARHRQALRVVDDQAKADGKEGRSEPSERRQKAAAALDAREAELLAAVLAVPALKISAEAQAALLYAAAKDGGGEALYGAVAKAIIASMDADRERKAFSLLCARVA